MYGSGRMKPCVWVESGEMLAPVWMICGRRLLSGIELVKGTMIVSLLMTLHCFGEAGILSRTKFEREDRLCLIHEAYRDIVRVGGAILRGHRVSYAACKILWSIAGGRDLYAIELYSGRQVCDVGAFCHPDDNAVGGRHFRKNKTLSYR